MSQVPLFFIGPLRENLDPFGESTDRALWDALEGVGIAALSREGLAGGQSGGLGAAAAELGGWG